MKRKLNTEPPLDFSRPHRHSADRPIPEEDLTRCSASARCARCNKVRKMWMRANELYSGKPRVASINIAGEGKVCWICRVREIDPDWRPGLPLPPEFIGGKNVQ